MSATASTDEALRAENADLRARLEEAEEMLRAIRAGEVDALVVEGDAEQNRLRSEMLAQVSDAVAAVDLEERITFLNAAAERQYGVRNSDVLGRKLAEIYTRRWPSPEQETAAWAALREHGEWHGEYLQRTHDGRELHVEASVTTLRNSDGTNIGWVAAIRDITARKRAEEALREKEHFLQRITQVTPGVLSVFDLVERRSVFMNRSVESVLGYSPEEVQAMGTEVVPTMMHPEDLPRFEQHIARVRALADGEVVDFEHRMRDEAGAWHWFHSHDAVFARDATGAARQLIGVATEITERKRAEQILADRTELLNGVLEATSDVIFVKDLNGRMLLVNAAFAAAAGSTPEQLVGKTDEDWFPPDVAAAVRQQDEAVIVAGSPMQFEETVPVAGEARSFLTLKAPLRDGSSRIVGILGIGRDITARKQTEDVLRLVKERFELAVKCSQVVLFQQDLELRYTWIQNPSPGFDGSDVVDKRDVDLMERAEDAAVTEGLKRDVLRTGVGMRQEVLVQIQGVERLYDLLVEPLLDAAGPIAGVTCAAIDITERKRAEEASREQKHFLERITAVTPDVLYVLDITDYHFKWVSPQAANRMGYSGEEILAMGADFMPRVMHPDDLARMPAHFAELARAENGQTLEIEYRLRRPDGTWRWFRGRKTPFSRDAKGNVREIIGTSSDITERKRAEEAIARLAAIVESSHDALFSEDLDGIITTWNRGAEDIFGYRAEEIIGTSILRLIPAAGQAEEHETQRKLAAGERGGTFETIRRTKDGREFPVSITVSALKDAAGQVIGTSRAARDITERKRAEESLRQNAALFSTLIAQAPMGTYVVDAQFRVREVNAEAMPAFANVQPLIGRDLGEVMEILWGAELGGQIADIFRHTLATGERYVSPPFTEQRHDLGIEQVYEWETQRMTLPDGQHGVVCYFHEVTERARVTWALRASQERMDLAAEATGVGIWEWNVVTNAIRWDAIMFRIYGIEPTPDGFVDYSDWSGAVLPADLAENEAILQDTVRRGGQSTREFRIRRRSDGECRWIQAVETVRANHEGKAAWVVGTNLDVTERQVTAQALRDTDRRKDEFLATLAHELRNPLAPMRTAVELLRMKSPDIPELQWARDVIDRQTQAMTRLIDDLMDVGRINQGKVTLKREQVELAKIVQGAVETSHPLIEEMGHELTVTLPPRTVIVDADLTRLAQVILNLLNNAAKYTERGGRIDLRAELQGSDVVVSVTDTGIGIPADKLPTLFEMFSQVEGALSRSQGGLGIGLCLVKRLVEMHGGSIEAKSDGPGRGSEFVVRLPIVVEQTYARPASHDGDKAKSITDLRILVVDDNRDAAESLAMLLKMMGNNVHTAHDGEEAVAAARKFRPDVVLCDIGLPKLNGYEACRQMKEQAWDKKMILIAVTGWGQDEDRRRSEEAGFDHHLVKPVDLNNLSNLLLGDPKLSHTPSGKSGPLRVLIVDDMRDARHMLSTLLKASGHDVQTAADGLTALSVALDFQPNVVLMDNSMPGMSGLEVAKQMRLEPKLKDAMLIALTGHGDEADRQRSLEAGFDHHLVKPPDISVIRELLGSIR